MSNFLNFDSDNDILDEELDIEIKNTKKELTSIENPQSIKSGFDVSNPDFNPQIIEDFYEKIRNMPRDKMETLLANLGKKHSELGSDYKLENMSENNQKKSKQRLKEKLSYLQIKRKSKINSNTELTNFSDDAYKHHEKNNVSNVSEHEKNNVNNVSEQKERNTEIENIDEKSLSKSQKKRQKEKARKARKEVNSKTSN